MSLDLTGKRFGRLVALTRAPSTRQPGGSVCRKWTCRCDCGEITTTSRAHLRSGDTSSCGCLQRELTGRRSTSHGEARRTGEYRSWAHLIERCENRNTKGWPLYGGRGIRVCGRWRRSYEKFLADMGRRPSSNHSIDRINNDGG